VAGGETATGDGAALRERSYSYRSGLAKSSLLPRLALYRSLYNDLHNRFSAPAANAATTRPRRA
jgi:hypothetical protein